MKKLFIFLLYTFTVIHLDAQYGKLDKDLDSDGILTYSFNDSTSYAVGVTSQSDGKIVLAGYGFNGTDLDFAMVRFFPDGTPDNTFGDNGKVLTDFHNDDLCSSMLVQPDGKIVLVGSTNSYNSWAIARYTKDGQPDMTFSGDGKDTAGYGISSDYGPDAVLLPNGKIVIAGVDYHNGKYYCSLVMYNSDGTLDDSFHPDNDTLNAEINAVTLSKNGNLLTTGYISNPDTYQDFVVGSYTQEGLPDGNFSFDGKASTNISVTDVSCDIGLQSDGKIVCAGYVYNVATFHTCLVRYNTDGSLDESFGDNGTVLMFPDNSQLEESINLLIQPDDKIICSGYNLDPVIMERNDMQVIRFNSDGSLDSTFGDHGVVRFSKNTSFNGRGMCLQHDGKLLVSGFTSNAANHEQMLLARLTTGLTPVSKVSSVKEPIVNIYPNPFTDAIQYSLPDGDQYSDLRVYNTEGQILYQTHLQSNVGKVSLNFLAPGIYVVKFTGNNSVSTQMVRKN